MKSKDLIDSVVSFIFMFIVVIISVPFLFALGISEFIKTIKDKIEGFKK